MGRWWLTSRLEAPSLVRKPGASCQAPSLPLVPGESDPAPATVTDDAAMRVALAEAALAAAAGDVPVGAVVVAGGEIVARRHNERESTRDPTAHAEVLALQDAAAVLGSWRLAGASLVVTLEPCVMCAGAVLAGRVARVVFGAYDPKGGACGSLYNVCVDPRLNHEAAVVSGVLAKECADLLRSYFAERRLRDGS
jgi:tRNA(adenine34) deaminase